MTNVSRQSEYLKTILDIYYQYLNEIASEMGKSEELFSRENKDRLISIHEGTDLERMALIDKEIEIIKEKIESIEERREADKEIIDDYLRIADTEFVKYKNSLLEMLDSDTFSTEEKVILLIYLCIIEKDFQSITEMG